MICILDRLSNINSPPAPLPWCLSSVAVLKQTSGLSPWRRFPCACLKRVPTQGTRRPRNRQTPSLSLRSECSALDIMPCTLPWGCGLILRTWSADDYAGRQPNCPEVHQNSSSLQHARICLSVRRDIDCRDPNFVFVVSITSVLRPFHSDLTRA